MGDSSLSISEKDTKSIQFGGDIGNETKEYDELSKNSSDDEESSQAIGESSEESEDLDTSFDDTDVDIDIGSYFF